MSRIVSNWRLGFPPSLALFLALLSTVGTLGCAAGGPFAEPARPTREAAIAHCIETTPAQSVLYADRFAACMEEQGWQHDAGG